MTDPLATPERRRAIWAEIVYIILSDQCDVDGYEDGARLALEFALSDDPPREWPAGTFGDLILRGAVAAGQEQKP